MRITRLYVTAPLAPGTAARIEGTAAAHVSRVLRARPGDLLTLFDGRGGEYRARLEQLRKDGVLVQVLEHRPIERESPCELTLAQGVSRGERMDFVVQKATELGARRIVPVLTERSVVRLDEAQSQRKLQHWRAVAIAACEQSGRNRLPEIPAPIGLAEFLAGSDGAGGLRLVLSPEGTERLQALQPATAVTALIGPEGGLSDPEREAALSRGFLPVRLGPRILRTETAAIAALAVLQHRCGDL